MKPPIKLVSENTSGTSINGSLDYSKLRADVKRLVEKGDRDNLRFLLHRHMLGGRLLEERELDDRRIVDLSEDLQVDRGIFDGSMKLARSWPNPDDLKKLVIDHRRKNGRLLTFSLLVQLADMGPGSQQFSEALEKTCNENLSEKGLKQLKSQSKARIKQAASAATDPTPREAIRATNHLTGEIEAFIRKVEDEMAKVESIIMDDEACKDFSALIKMFGRLSDVALTNTALLNQRVQAFKLQSTTTAAPPLRVVENDKTTANTDWDDPIEPSQGPQVEEGEPATEDHDG